LFAQRELATLSSSLTNQPQEDFSTYSIGWRFLKRRNMFSPLNKGKKRVLKIKEKYDRFLYERALTTFALARKC
jgi:hypothetical protein